MANGLLFGTGGSPHSAPAHSTVAGIRRIHELGLQAMEVEFVHGVKMSAESALEVKQTASELGVQLSVHAPYAVNLNSSDAAKLEASKQRLVQAARIGALCGARNIVLHAAFYGDDSSARTHETVLKHLTDVVDTVSRESKATCLRPELMGRHSQYGTLEEILELCSAIHGIAPTIDFAHWHARTGRFNTYEEFKVMLNLISDRLGPEALRDMHIHVSGIEYGKHGEVKHLNLEESDFDYYALVKALQDVSAAGLVICESPNLEDDAVLLKNASEGVRDGHRIGQAKADRLMQPKLL